MSDKAFWTTKISKNSTRHISPRGRLQPCGSDPEALRFMAMVYGAVLAYLASNLCLGWELLILKTDRSTALNRGRLLL